MPKSKKQRRHKGKQAQSAPPQKAFPWPGCFQVYGPNGQQQPMMSMAPGQSSSHALVPFHAHAATEGPQQHGAAGGSSSDSDSSSDESSKSSTSSSQPRKSKKKQHNNKGKAKKAKGSKKKKKRHKKRTHETSSSSSGEEENDEFDLEQTIGTTYKTLGGSGRTAYPKRLRVDVLRGVDESLFNPIRASALTDRQVDMCLYVATNLQPTVRLCDLGCRTRLQLKQALVQEASRLGNRVNAIGADYHNVESVAMSYGWKEAGKNARVEASSAGLPTPEQLQQYAAMWSRIAPPGPLEASVCFINNVTIVLMSFP